MVVFLLFLLLLCPSVQARDMGFDIWRDNLAAQALREGITPETLRVVIPALQFDPSVIRYDRQQPEKGSNFDRYYKNVVTSWRIEEGRRLAIQHKAILEKLSAHYGTPPSVILALWAIESGFGTNTGDYSVINSLATLAYEGRRASFFRGELMDALKIVDLEKRDPFSLRGSWAGAMGQCQFMPSTYRKFAIDGDGDGIRDIWENESDVLASIAHYLSAEGWIAGEGWGTEVRLQKAIPKAERGLEITRTLKEWKKRGVYPAKGMVFPSNVKKASLIQFRGAKGGRSFLTYDNFRVLMRWNRSTYFASSVGLLSDEIEKGH